MVRDAAEALLTAGDWEAAAAASVPAAGLAAALHLTPASVERELTAARERLVWRGPRKTLPLPPPEARAAVARHCAVCARPITGRPSHAKTCSEECAAERHRRRKRDIHVENARGGRARHCPTLSKLR